MKVVSLGLIFAVLLTSAYGQGNIVSDNIYRFLYSFRDSMPCGFANAGIPPLAPLRHAFLPVNINLNQLSFRGNFINLHVTDLNTYQVRNVDFNIVSMRLDIHLFYNSVSASGSFSNGFGQTPNSCVISGNGAFAVRPNQINYFVSSWLVLRDNTLMVGDMNSRVTIGSFNSNIQHFVGNAAQSNNCNRNLELWMPWIVHNSPVAINQFLDDLIRPIANRLISGMTLQDLLDFLINPPPQPVCQRL